MPRVKKLPTDLPIGQFSDHHELRVLVSKVSINLLQTELAYSKARVAEKIAKIKAPKTEPLRSQSELLRWLKKHPDSEQLTRQFQRIALQLFTPPGITGSDGVVRAYKWLRRVYRQETFPERASARGRPPWYTSPRQIERLAWGDLLTRLYNATTPARLAATRRNPLS